MNDDDFIRRISQNARDAAPGLLSADQGENMIAHAIAAAQQQAQRRRHRRLAALAAVVLLGGMGLGWGASQHDPEPLHAQLPTGDQLTATPGADFRVASASVQLRHVEVRHGVVLFDVSPLEGEERFEVTTADTVVRVRGTVFSVERENGRTSVRVYEGRVELEHEGHRQMVVAGWMWLGGNLVTLGEGRLEQAGIAAALTRTQRASAAVSDPAVGTHAGGLEFQPAEPIAAQQPSEGGETEVSEATEATVLAVVPDDTPRAVPTAAPRAAAHVTHSQVRQWIASRDYGRALVAARVHHWTLLEADALRGLRRFEEAANTYLRVSNEPRAAYAAARIRFFELGDAASALTALDTVRPGSPLDERVLGLRTRLLFRQGRQHEAQQHAADYLRRYPEGGLADWMSELAAQR